MDNHTKDWQEINNIRYFIGEIEELEDQEECATTNSPTTNDFNRLCSQYGLLQMSLDIVKQEMSDEEANCIYLYTYFMQGEPEILGYTLSNANDFSALSIAKLLKQLSFCDTMGKFSINVAPYEITYTDNTLIEILKESLSIALSARIEKDRNAMWLHKNDNKLLGFKIPYPEGIEKQENGWSTDELNLIIKHQEKALAEYNCFKGKGKGNGKFIPEMGKYAMDIAEHLPKDWSKTLTACFIIDFMTESGFLTNKGELFIEDVKSWSNNEKQHKVDSWITSYKKILEKNFRNLKP